MDDSTPKRFVVTERRKYLRLSAMGLVNMNIQGEGPQGAYLANISRGGVGIYLHQETKPKQLVVLGLKLIEEGQAGQELKIAARIQWGRPVGELYMSGLKFEKMSDNRYRMLLRHLSVMEELQLGS